jgi:hypothetical protein
MKFHGNPWNFTKFSKEFQGIPHKHLTDFSMEFFHGISWKI